MRQISRISSDMVNSECALRMPLPILRRGPVLPLNSMDGMAHPIAVPDDGT